MRPEEPLDLEPNGRYQITIVDEQESEEPSLQELDDGASRWAEPEEFPLMKYARLARDLGFPSDLAEQHDHYLYGVPKR